MSPTVWNQRDWRVPQLRCAARARKISRYSRKRRAELQESLRQHDAAVRIQRFLRRRGPAVTNTDCPITLQRLPYSDPGRLFCFTTSNNCRIAYSPTALASYVASTGSRADPVTRERYSNADIERLKAMVPELRTRIDRVLQPFQVNSALTRTILLDMGTDLISAASHDPDEFLAFLLLQWATAYTMISASALGDVEMVQSVHREVLQNFHDSRAYREMDTSARQTADSLLAVIDSTVARGARPHELMVHFE